MIYAIMIYANIVCIMLTFFYHLALLDLQQLLSEKTDKHCNPLDMPRELILQFDNCPENKVEYIFVKYF